MKKIYIFPQSLALVAVFLFSTLALFSQERPSCELIQNTDIIQDLNTLNNYNGSMDSVLLLPAPSPLCPSGGGPNNMTWFAFVAGFGAYSIEVVPLNCQPHLSGAIGIQSGVYSDCTFEESIICDPNCSYYPISLVSDLLKPGETYFFFLDGCIGSICDFELNITGNFIPFNIFRSINDISCYNACNGSVSIDSATYGMPPYTYLWNTGDTSATISDLCEGSYFCKVTDALNITRTTAEYDIVNPVPINTQAQVINQSASSNGSISVQPINGISPYDLQWSTGATTDTIHDLTSGQYVVTVTDANNCQIIDSIIINDCTVFDTINGLLGFLGPSTICVANATRLSPVSGGTWSTADGSIATVTNAGLAIGMSPGTVNITYNDNISGCSYVLEDTLVVLPIPYVSIKGSTLLCMEETMQLSTTMEGIWSSSNDSIATVNSSGIVSGISPGPVCFTLISNQNGCNSSCIKIFVEDCSISCDSLFQGTVPVVRGYAYIDSNENGIYDSNETPLRNVKIKDPASKMIAITDQFGRYHVFTAVGDRTITAKISEGDWLESYLLQTILIDSHCKEDVNFGYILVPTDPKVSVSMSHSILRCDMESKFYIDFENISSEELDGRLEFYYDPITTYANAGPIPLSIDEQIVTFDIEGLKPFEPKSYIVVLNLPPGANPPPTMEFKARILNEQGEIMASYNFADVLRCSFDPNDKSNYPVRDGVDNFTLFSEYLEYTIRFQNTGNDTAFTVKIVDELDTSIDPESIRVISSSHTVETTIEEENRLVFLFEDINLVDSSASYLASQGYVTFRCDQKGFRSEMTQVFNHADIIFDSNPPIITNEVKNTLVSYLCTTKTTELHLKFCPGGSYEGYTEEGTYIDSLLTPHGCDSVRILEIIYKETPLIAIDTSICPEDSIYGLSETGSYTLTLSAAEGCDTTVTINLLVLEPSNALCYNGVRPIRENEIYLYPNPANSNVHISGIEGEVQLLIRSIDGIVYPIYPTKVNEELLINTNTMPTGVYIVEIRSVANDNYIEYQKLSVIH